LPYFEQSDGDGADFDDEEKYVYDDPKVRLKAMRDRIEQEMEDFVTQPNSKGKFPGPRSNIRQMIVSRSIRTHGVNTD